MSHRFRLKVILSFDGDRKGEGGKSDEWKQKAEDDQDDEEGKTDDVGYRHHPGDSGPALAPRARLYVLLHICISKMY